MSLDRDLQSKLAALQFDTVTIAGQGAAVYTQIVDTMPVTGGFRNLYFSIEPAAAITPITETLRVIAQESIDGINWVDASYKLLPTRHSTLTGQTIFNATAPFLQTFGLQSSSRYVRLGAIADVFDNQIAIFFNIFMEKQDQDFLEYDPTLPVVPNDTLP